MERTPGPWEYAAKETETGGYVVTSEDGWNIAQTVAGPGTGLERDNARILASSPELLLGCELAYKYVCGHKEAMERETLAILLRNIIRTATVPEEEDDI